MESKNTYNYLRERLVSSTGVLSTLRKSRTSESSLNRYSLLFIASSNFLLYLDKIYYKFKDFCLISRFMNYVFIWKNELVELWTLNRHHCCCSLSGNDNRYSSLAEQLRQRIVELKIKIDQQLRMLEDVKAQIKTQFLSIQRLEVKMHLQATLLRIRL